MPRLTPVNPDTATGRTKELLDGVKAKVGVVPNLIRTFANSEAVLEGYVGFSGGLAGGSLGPKVAEQIALAVAGANGCDYCASAHTLAGKGQGVDDRELTRNLDGQSEDARIQVILDFARAVVDKRGWVDDADLAGVRLAGLDEGEIAEIVALVALNTFTNYFNHVAGTEIDFPVVRANQAEAA